VSRPIRIVLADDHSVVRSALRLLLDAEEDFEVVAEAGDVDSTLRYVRGHKPDMLILDFDIPGGSALDLVPELHDACPQAGTVVLAREAEPAMAREAMRRGVLGYLLKDAVEDELVTAVRLAARGKTYLQSELGTRLARETDEEDNLSDREVEVLRRIALGHTNAEIAELLEISVRTVESHRSHIQQKLGVAKRSELVGYAIRRGLLRG
jgi:two-component system response regulator NreC